MEERNKHYKETGKLDTIELFKLSFPKEEVASAFLFNIYKYNNRIGKKKSIAEPVLDEAIEVVRGKFADLNKYVETESTLKPFDFREMLFNDIVDEFAKLITKYDELQRLQDIEKMNDYILELKQLNNE
jgi:hypothetical protein